MGGAADGVGAALPQAGVEHVARARGDREQGVVAADMAVREALRPLLGEAVRLAHRGVDVDRERRGAGTGARGPRPPQQLAADAVELAHVAQAEAAQERAQGRRRPGLEPEHRVRAARAQRVRVVDAVAAREGGHHEARDLVAGVGPSGRLPEVHVAVDELAQAEAAEQGGRQEQPGIRDELRRVERRVDPVEPVGRSHPPGAPLSGSDWCVATPSSLFRRAPVAVSRIVNHSEVSVDPGLSDTPFALDERQMTQHSIKARVLVQSSPQDRPDLR